MHHTEAVILRKDEWNEADWLVTALTRDFGRLRLLAQGARKRGAKLQGHLEPGTVAELWFVIGRNGYRLTTARLRERFPEIERSWAKLGAVSSALFALDQNLWEERERSEELFGLVLATLRALASAADDGIVRNLTVWFHLRFFAFLGVLPPPDAPEVERCRKLLEFGARSLAALRAEPATREPEFSRLLQWLGAAVRVALPARS